MDYAHVLKDLADLHFAQAKIIVLVQTISTSTLRSLPGRRSQAPGRALRMTLHSKARRLATSELGVLSSQCLDRRIPDKQALVEEIAAWVHDRNADHIKANWHFTTPNARIRVDCFKGIRPPPPAPPLHFNLNESAD